MSDSKDIMREFVDLFKKEDMIAFFDFQYVREGKETISGLCKISKSKAIRTLMNYLSLVFIIDTPNRDVRLLIDNIMKRFNEDNLKKELPELQSIVSMPSIHASPKNYIKEFDIILDSHFRVDNDFIKKKLHPSVRRITKFQTSELTWWNELSENQNIPSTQQKDKSILEKLKQYYRTKSQ